MFHILIIVEGDVTKVLKKTLVDGQMFVDVMPREGSTNLVCSGGVFDAMSELYDITIRDILDDGTKSGDTTTFKVSSAEADKFTVGHYLLYDGEIWVCSGKTQDDDKYDIELTKQDGVVPVLNNLVDRIAALET